MTRAMWSGSLIFVLLLVSGVHSTRLRDDDAGFKAAAPDQDAEDVANKAAEDAKKEVAAENEKKAEEAQEKNLENAKLAAGELEKKAETAKQKAKAARQKAEEKKKKAEEEAKKAEQAAKEAEDAEKNQAKAAPSAAPAAAPAGAKKQTEEDEFKALAKLKKKTDAQTQKDKADKAKKEAEVESEKAFNAEKDAAEKAHAVDKAKKKGNSAKKAGAEKEAAKSSKEDEASKKKKAAAEEAAKKKKAPTPVVEDAPKKAKASVPTVEVKQDPFSDMEPFGREETAQVLTEKSIKESNKMIDQIERAEVAEEKRAVFRALTHLRGAAISSFDGVAKDHTNNIQKYSAESKWRADHPIKTLASEEDDTHNWAFPDKADFF
eukprot:TRINITY_DN3619_c0_g2_i1.p1 TRINITY_DN3619_c0_g2~~TRINITY_DN3619_c0_g2_i1.p1  ORF type:complete len:420 (+),score=179.64 TRINITY_DN3619_c0_g2_i1:130-1260(+)